MLIGKFPSQEFLKKFELDDDYWPICEACQIGNIKRFEEHLDEKMSVLI
jgi:hypothetical protein